MKGERGGARIVMVRFQGTREEMFGDLVQLIGGEHVISLHGMEHVHLKPSMSRPDIHAIVSHGRGAQELLLEFHLA